MIYTTGRQHRRGEWRGVRAHCRRRLADPPAVVASVCGPIAEERSKTHVFWAVSSRTQLFDSRSDSERFTYRDAEDLKPARSRHTANKTTLLSRSNPYCWPSGRLMGPFMSPPSTGCFDPRFRKVVAVEPDGHFVTSNWQGPWPRKPFTPVLTHNSPPRSGVHGQWPLGPRRLSLCLNHARVLHTTKSLRPCFYVANSLRTWA